MDIDCPGVRSHAYELLLHGVSHIVFVHREVQGSNVVLAGDYEVQQCVKRVFVFIARYLRQRFTLVMLERGVEHRRNQNALRAACAPPHVLRAAIVPGELSPDRRADLRISQAVDKDFRTAFVVLGGNGCAQRGAGGDVRILVGRDIQTGGARCFDGGNDITHLAPVLSAADLQVPYLHRNVGFAANAKGLVQGLHLAIALVADMRCVNASVLRGNFCQRDQFVGFGVKGGRVDQ